MAKRDALVGVLLRPVLGAMLCAMLGGALAACGADATSCPNDLPAACPAPAPSFATDIDPLIGARCRPCHVPGGRASFRPFTGYAEIHAARSLILNQVYACYMPPGDATPLAPSERTALLTWLVCGAPND